MRITVLQQQVKTLKDEQPKLDEEVARELESIKHFLWHGDTFQAVERLEGLLIDLEFPEVPSPLTQKVASANALDTPRSTSTAADPDKGA